jgi:ATP-binding cassette, subfamily B (MDR/TAP), member 1
VAIARSIIKEPSIIILDEATSAIDVRSERIVQAALDKATRHRTTITIAHRLSTIKKADHIIVLQKGRAVEEGTHQELMVSDVGVYSALVRAQSLGLAQAQGADDEGQKSDREPDPCHEVGNVCIEQKQDPAGSQANTRPRETLVTGVKPRSLMSSFGTLLYNQHSQWPRYLGIVLSSMATAAGTPVQAYLFSKVISVFLLTGDDLKRESSFWGLIWLCLAAGVGLSYLAVGWIGLLVQHSISSVYKKQYFSDMLYQKISFFDQDANSHGALSARVGSDAKRLEELLGMNLALFLSGIFIAVGSVTIAIIFAWKLGLIAALVTMPVMLASGLWKFRQEVNYEKSNSAVFQESSQFATEAIGAIRTVSSLTMEGSIGERYRQLLDNQVKAALRKGRWTSLLYGFADSVGLGCQALIFWYGGKRLVTGEYSLEAFLICFMAIVQGAEAASQSLAVAPNASQAAAAANRILDVHDSAVAGRSDACENLGRDTTKDGGSEGIDIELQDVCFKYPTRDVPIFDQLSLKVEKGQYAALVGPSGCGKSTILSLLERFYELGPQQGSVLFNGHNINNSNVYQYRKSISLVAQEPVMFRGTIRDNILLGIEDPESVSGERIIEVCRDAFIHDFIISLPEGYDTRVSAQGISLSGGQKQRIAVARALIRDPKVLLLDEATSALDSESEKMVQAALEKARKGRTMVAVAHRLSTIQTADVIFVFEQGRVVEKGTHDQLVQKRGVYWGMVSCSIWPLRVP